MHVSYTHLDVYKRQVLSQVQNGEERVIGYYSKTLSKPERNYCVTRRELLATVRALEHFHKYLYGREFSLRTDDAALAWLLSFKNNNFYFNGTE